MLSFMSEFVFRGYLFLISKVKGHPLLTVFVSILFLLAVFAIIYIAGYLEGKGYEDGREAAFSKQDLDGDGVLNKQDKCPQSKKNSKGHLPDDYDKDGCHDEEDDDDDGDGVKDNKFDRALDLCSRGKTGWESERSIDKDGDGCHDADEDIDDDGDGLIEIATARELDAVRYQLDGKGRKFSWEEALNTTGCVGDDDIMFCKGYELIANISLDKPEYDNWQPLGEDIRRRPGCQGYSFDAIFEGNDFMISNLNINRPKQDCVGLFGYIAPRSEIRNLRLSAKTVIGRSRVGALVGSGVSARIVSSSVMVDEVRGDSRVGGLVGNGESAQIYSSSVVADVVEDRGNENDPYSKVSEVGGLVGWGNRIKIYSSWVVADRVTGTGKHVGGLMGHGKWAHIYSSSVVVKEVKGERGRVGGLVGYFQHGRVAYSYVVSPSNAHMLVDNDKKADGEHADSYWDSSISGRSKDFRRRGRKDKGYDGEPMTSEKLHNPVGYTTPYKNWKDDTVRFTGKVPNAEDVDGLLAVWCDENGNGKIDQKESDEKEGIRVWNFGNSSEYPAINCTPIKPDEWRSLWSVENGKFKLHKDRWKKLFP